MSCRSCWIIILAYMDSFLAVTACNNNDPASCIPIQINLATYCIIGEKIDALFSLYYIELTERLHALAINKQN